MMRVHAEFEGGRVRSVGGLFRAWRRCAENAADTRSIPVIALFGPTSPGKLLIVDQYDLERLTGRIAELEAALS